MKFCRTLPSNLLKAKRARSHSFGGGGQLTLTTSEVLTNTQALADYFDPSSKLEAPGKAAANGADRTSRGLNFSGEEIETQPKSRPLALAELLSSSNPQYYQPAPSGKKVFPPFSESTRRT